MQVDVAIVGAGGAGLNLVAALDRRLNSADAPAGAPRPTVALIDPVHRRHEDRTWCFWDEGLSPIEPVVHRAWRQVAVVGPDGRQRRLSLGGLRYVMVRSADFYALADDAAARLAAVRVPVAVDAIEDGPDHAVIRAGSERIRARWVFDSRPAAPVRAGRTTLLQHFRGWRVRFHHAALDETLPVLMDFSVPQPAQGTAFCYVLPSDRRTGLVEYTVFSRERLATERYDAAIQAYLTDRWGTGGAPGTYRIEEVEDGVIPMTDAVFERRVGRRVFRIGTAGGATRPATGFTFAAMQRQADTMAQALLAGRAPVPPRPHARRHRWLDAVMLRALDQGHLDGPELFTLLFDRNPVDRVLRFLDGANPLSGDLALVASAPKGPMLRAAAEDLTARLLRR